MSPASLAEAIHRPRRELRRSAKVIDQTPACGLDLAEATLEVGRPAVPRVIDLKRPRGDRASIELPQQPHLLGVFGPSSRAAQLPDVAPIGGQHEVHRPELSRVELACPMGRSVVPMPPQNRDSPGVGTVADVPSAGPRRAHHDVRHVGLVEHRAQDDLAHGGPADVPRADHLDAHQPLRVTRSTVVNSHDASQPPARAQPKPTLRNYLTVWKVVS